MLKYKNFSLIKPNQEQCKKISDIIIENNGSIFHEVELNKIVKENFNTELYYLVDNGENIKNFTPVHITKNRFGLNQYHFKPLADIPYAGFLKEEAIDFESINIGVFESMVYSGFPKEKKLKVQSNIKISGETTMVDLSLDESEIFTTVINSKRRNMIRKAEKSGIIVKRFFTQEGLLQFWPMLDSLHRKLGYEHLKFDYYQRILQDYGNKKQAFILIAYKDEKPVSGVFILGNMNYMHYYKGASVFDVKNEGQGELLQWEAIKASKNIGTKYYDLCNLDNQKLPAIYRFKTGISQDIYPYLKYSNTSLGFKIINRFNKIF